MPKPKLTPKQLDDLDMMKASTFYGGDKGEGGRYAYVEVDNRGWKPYRTRPVQALLDKGIIRIPQDKNRGFYGRVESMKAYIVYLNPVAWEYPFQYSYDESLEQVGNKIVRNTEDFGAEKKNCGCGQDPCVTYGADGAYMRKTKSQTYENEKWGIFWDGDSRYRWYGISLIDNPNDFRIVAEYDANATYPYALSIPRPDEVKQFRTFNELLEHLDNMMERGQLGVFAHGVDGNRMRGRSKYPTVGDWTWYGAEEFGAEEGRVRTISGRELMKRIRRTPQQIEEEMRNNPPCEECGSATTEEVRSGVEGTYEYVCYDDECEWSSFPPHTDYGARRVRTMSGKPHTPRKMVKDKDITPEEASKRLNLEAEGKTYYREGREAAKAVFMPDLDERDSYGQLDTEYMVYFDLTPEEMVQDIEMQNPRYNQFAWGWSQGWDDATFEHLLNTDDNTTVMDDYNYSADTETFNGYYVGSGWQEEYIPDEKDFLNSFVIGGAAILGFLGVNYMKRRMGAETFNAPASCTDEDSCDDGFTCVDGECIKTCKDDGDCASWQECRDDLHPTENVCGEDKTYSTSNPFTQKQQTSSNVDDSPSSSIKPVGMTMTRKVVIGGSVIGVAAIGLAAMQNRNKNGGEE